MREAHPRVRHAASLSGRCELVHFACRFTQRKYRPRYRGTGSRTPARLIGTPDLMAHLLKQNGVQVALLFIVFLLFLANGTGLFEFNSLDNGISFRTGMLGPKGYGLVLPPVARSAGFIILCLSGFLLCLLLPVLSPIQGSLATGAVALPPLYLGLTSPTANSFVPMEFSLLTIAVIYSLNVLLSYFREARMKERIITIFGQYVPPGVVEEISRHPEQLTLESQARVLTVLFCDLQDFSGVAEQLNPKQLTMLLNEYFDDMTEVLYRHGATIDKYIGDCIMAFWGAPLPRTDHAQQAVLASFDMHQCIARLHEQFVHRGWPAPGMGIGINTGMMSVGNMGSRYRMAYTVLGDAVNLASRLETLTRTYHVPTIVSEATRKGCPEVIFRTLDVVQVRGKHNLTVIHQPLCRRDAVQPERVRLLEQHEAAAQEMLAENWRAARAAYMRLQNAAPDDPVYPVLIQKCDMMSRG